MKSINDLKELNDIPEKDYVLITKLEYPDHVQQKDRIHKPKCYTLKPAKQRKKMPTNRNYYHIKSSEEEILNRYKNNKCPKCCNYS